MKIIDGYKTPDGKFEYRVEHEGEMFPPLSFNEPQSLYKLQKVIEQIIASREQAEKERQERFIESIPMVTIDTIDTIDGGSNGS